MTPLQSQISVNFSELLFSVSEAMDLANPTLPEHHIRTAYMALRIAEVSDCTPSLVQRLFVAALLHDIGALSPEDRIAVNLMEEVDPKAHCARGYHLLSQTFWLAPAARIVEWHHTDMNTHVADGRDISNDEVLAAQILFVAERVERSVRRDQYILHQFESIRARMCAAPSSDVHPAIIECFSEASSSEDFWLRLCSSTLPAEMRRASPVNSVVVEYRDLHSICSVFKNMIDFRSPFTATHSRGVAACAHEIALRMGFSGDELRQVELAGYLHDIGKLVVPNAILEKPGPLSKEERQFLLQHVHHTHRLLSQVRGFEKIAEWAAQHHERLDGSGYVRRSSAGDIDLGARIIAVADIATAVAEHRPYRAGVADDGVLEILRDMAIAGQIDLAVVNTFAADSNEIADQVKRAQHADLLLFSEFSRHD